jgi:hypothetical protein
LSLTASAAIIAGLDRRLNPINEYSSYRDLALLESLEESNSFQANQGFGSRDEHEPGADRVADHVADSFYPGV